MGNTVQCNDGTQLPLDSVPQEITYSGEFVTSITAYYQGKSFVQTFLNDGSNITYISNWQNPDYPQLAGQIMTDESGNIMVDESGNLMTTEY